MITERKKYKERVSQGDIYKDVWCFENISEDSENLYIKRVKFPYVVVLTQDCDIQQHNEYVNRKSGQLFSVLVAPVYNVATFMEGKHLEKLNLDAPSYLVSKNKGKILNETGQYINSTGMSIINNDIQRFHYIPLDENVEIPPCVVDFKNYFSVGMEFLANDKKNDFVCRLKPLYRELLTQRFSNFLSRIGLPNPMTDFEKKLDLLQKMLEEKLITEQEYNLKKDLIENT